MKTQPSKHVVTKPQPSRARSRQPERLTQSAKAPNSNLPYSAACLADRQLSEIYAVHNRSILPNAIRHLREARDLTQYAVALRAGISRDMLVRVENGRSVPTFFLLSKIMYALGVTWGQFASVLDKMVAGKM
ncbi:MAG: helix-turn-helix domain-containing protein [Verrucomicrobiota bacterium]